MACYQKSTSGVYLQNKFNSQENIMKIEIKYWFWLKDYLGQYYEMKMERK